MGETTEWTINSDALAALVEIVDIIDQGDTSEAWQVALMRARAVIAASGIPELPRYE